jgi:acetyltransferase-like isoleucine patch superfamily enzyme
MKNIIQRIANNFYNNIITHVPFNFLRILILKYLFRMKIGTGVCLAPKVKIINPWRITVGNNSVINSSVFLDGRGGLYIGDNVDIAWFSKIITLKHDYNDKNYKASGASVIISDYCCLAVSATVLPGVKLAKGVVIGSSSVVTKSITNEFVICVGIPCVEIKKRNKEVNYKLTSRSVTI